MAIQFACPSCQKSLRVPDEHAGRLVTCPSCVASVSVPTIDREDAGAAADAWSAGWAPPQELLEGGKVAALEPGWRVARRGLSVAHGSGVLMLLAVGILFAAGIIVAARGGMAAGRRHVLPDEIVVLSGICGAGMIAAAVGYSIGLVLACWAPSSGRVRVHAVSAILSFVAWIAVVGAISAMEEGAGNPPRAAAAFSNLLLILGFLCVAAYTRGIGRHFEDERLRTSSRRWMLFAGLGVPAYVIGLIVLAAVAAAARQPGAAVVLLSLFTLAFLIALVVGCLWHLRLLRGAAATIRRAQLGTAEG